MTRNRVRSLGAARKKWFCYGNKIRDNKSFFFFATTKNFAAATKRFVDRTKHLVVVTKYFSYPYLNDFVGMTKPFIPWAPLVRLT